MSTYSYIDEKLTAAWQSWNNLCTALGLPRQYAYNWKAGVNRSYMHRLKGIATFLDVSVEELKAAASAEEKSVVEAEAIRIRNAQAKAAGTAGKPANADTAKAPKVVKAKAEPTKVTKKAPKATKATKPPKVEESSKTPKAPKTYTEKSMEQLLADLFVIFVGLSHQSQVELINIASQMEKEKG